MIPELKIFLIKIAVMIGLTPFMGYAMMKGVEDFEKLWKTNKRKKKWIASCIAFLALAIIGGWLR